MPRRPPTLPAQLASLARSQEGLVSARQCVAAGLSPRQAPEAAARGQWQRVARGVYDLASCVDLPTADVADRTRRRAAILGPLALPGSVATGMCALVLHGVQGTPPGLTPEVAFPNGTSRRSMAPVRLRRLCLTSWSEIDGIRCADTVEALAQAVPGTSRRHAVAVMDSALHLGLISPEKLGQAHALGRYRPRVSVTHDWWDDANALAESPAETWARLACSDAGWPADVLQLKIFTRDGRFLARVDLAWRLPDGRWLLVEIDGAAVHDTPTAVFTDRARQNSIATSQTILRRYTGSEAWRGAFVLEIASILAGAGWRAGAAVPNQVYL